MDLTLVIIIGVIVLGASLIGGFRIAQMQNRRSNAVRLVGTLVVALILGASVLLDLQDRGNEQPPANPVEQAPSQPTLTIPQTEQLQLNQTVTYDLSAGDQLALSFGGEIGQVVTLTVSPESGIAPDVTIITQLEGNPPIRDRMIRPRGNVTVICGYEFNFNGTFTFTFQAPETTAYTIEFVAGNTCRG